MKKWWLPKGISEGFKTLPRVRTVKRRGFTFREPNGGGAHNLRRRDSQLYHSHRIGKGKNLDRFTRLLERRETFRVGGIRHGKKKERLYC